LILGNYVVYDLAPGRFKPFKTVFGQLTVERITPGNVQDLTESFSPGKVSVFQEKLQRNHTGVFGRHKGKVVGYMWSGEYDTNKTVKADGYVPLKGRFSHIHFAQVTKEMRGRGLQLLMATWLINDAFSRSIEKIYTDIEVKNNIAMRGMCKLGFSENFRFFTLRSKSGPCFCLRYKNSNN